MPEKNNLIGVFGGTFDPIHNGHLQIARCALAELPLDALQFVPCYLPPHHKVPGASAAHRVAMLKLAVASQPRCTVNTIELQRDMPSYTIDTLKQLAKPDQTLCFIMGMDSFLQFDQWHKWQDILNYCHLILVNRPDYTLENHPKIAQLLKLHYAADYNALTQQYHGAICTLSITPQSTASTQIRQNPNRNSRMLPTAVVQYIKENDLYQCFDNK